MTTQKIIGGIVKNQAYDGKCLVYKAIVDTIFETSIKTASSILNYDNSRNC